LRAEVAERRWTGHGESGTELTIVIRGGGDYGNGYGDRSPEERARAQADADRVNAALRYTAEPPARQLDTVGGLEMFVGRMGRGTLDTSPDLLPCPFCGHEGAFTDGARRGSGDNHTVAAACSNTSCGVRTPEHYQDRESAAAAWNRRRRAEPSATQRHEQSRELEERFGDSVNRAEPPARIDPYRPAHTADVAPTRDSTAGPGLSGNRGAPHE
jgi:hypothetical protein